jgi:light-regulated signal transduction histidine kinase (bacteriophytochrome)
MVSDISAWKRFEEEIEVLNTNLSARALELEIANEELEAFSYTVSHDLRKPLTAISGYSQLVMGLFGDSLGNDCRDYLREIVASSGRMNQLIDTLLDFSRLARRELHRETVDLSAMAQAIIAELRLADTQRRVSCTIAQGVVVNGDAKLLRVVMDNLLRNAWKYSAKTEEAAIAFGVTEQRGKTACFVRDNGVGFDMSHAHRLFAVFQRLHSADEFEGTGIGLATVYRIIQRHGGMVWAEGERGKGATFYFTL